MGYGTFNAYENYNVFYFQNKLTETRDKERYYPAYFNINLPKRIRHYSLGGMNQFIFNYDNKQALYIYTDIYNSSVITLDTMYTPSQVEVESIIDKQFYSINPRGKFSIEKNKFNKRRNHLIVKRNAATIILYNIKKGNIETFIKSASTFTFMNNPKNITKVKAL
ncbi:hypothetical protein D3H65_09135 [Paraflavitalea soli]|uniref:Uncharacterized protein n=2 Tax=Paraflavitalea soli TaxID=2315862 RepID=A0A3B7MMF7_9BACT|nr:hypothetical protein D3H65_09135 [Paraflavitalea soli]